MSILKLKDSQGNWIGVPTIKGNTGNGIQSAVLNNDYTLTLTFTDGTTYTTPSIRGEKGEKGEPATDMEIHICSASEYDSETRIPTIANPNSSTFYLVPTEDGTSPDLFTEWVYVNGAWEMFGSAKIDLSGYLTDVQINGQSIVENGVANVPTASASRLGVVKTSDANGIYVNSDGALSISEASSANVKTGTNVYKPITPHIEHEATFFGLAKASGDTTQSQSSNAVGNYTEDAKTKIKKMIGVDEWEKIADFTLENELPANTGMDIPAYNSEPYTLKSFMLLCYPTINQSTSTFVQIKLNGDSAYEFTTPQTWASKISRGYVLFERKGDVIIPTALAQDNFSISNTLQGGKFIDAIDINMVRIVTSTTALAAGHRIVLYGIRV